MQTKQPLMPHSIGTHEESADAGQALRCPRCQGTGHHLSWVARKANDQFAPWFTWIPCPKCQGTGYLTEEVNITKEEARCQ